MTADRLNVILVSKKNPESEKLFSDLVGDSRYVVRLIETAQEALVHITNDNPNCVIFNFDRFGYPQIKLLEGIRQIAGVFQIVIFADEADPESVKEVEKMNGLVVIEKPLLNLSKDVTGLCQRLIGGDQVFQRESKRLPTNQSANIEFLETPHSVRGTVIDLSKKGCCVLSSTGNYRKGDKLRITIDLDKLGKKRVIIGEVRWASLKPARHIAGLKFVKSED